MGSLALLLSSLTFSMPSTRVKRGPNLPQRKKDNNDSIFAPRRSSRLSLARGVLNRSCSKPSITRYNDLKPEDEPDDMISDHDDSSFSSSVSPSLSPSPGDAASSLASASASILSHKGFRQPRKSSLKDCLGQEWTTRDCHRYWPAEGWTNDSQVVLTRCSSTKGGKVEWKELSWRTDDNNGNVQESSTSIRSRHVEQENKKNRSGRVIKTVEKEYPGGIIKKRTRSDPLPPKRRATTPPSNSHLRVGNPNRPQSAMKHRSANEYSLSSREESMTVVTSHHQMPEADTSPVHSPFVSINNYNTIQLTKAVEASETDDPDAFSPLTKRTQVAKYILKARPSLPKSSFYERHKEEEGSPTPESRRGDSISVT